LIITLPSTSWPISTFRLRKRPGASSTSTNEISPLPTTALAGMTGTDCLAAAMIVILANISGLSRPRGLLTRQRT
jgi:hypothetical protein